MLPPLADILSSLIWYSESMLVQAFVAKLTVETFHKGILGRLTSLDKAQLDIAFLPPEKHRFPCKFGAIVTNSQWRQCPLPTQLLEKTGNLVASDRYRHESCLRQALGFQQPMQQEITVAGVFRGSAFKRALSACCSLGMAW